LLCKQSRRSAIAIDQIFEEIVLNVLTRNLFLQLLIDGIFAQRTGPKDGKVDFRKLFAEEALDFLVGFKLLTKIVGRKRQDGKSPILKRFLQLDQFRKVNFCFASFARCIDNQCHQSSVFH